MPTYKVQKLVPVPGAQGQTRAQWQTIARSRDKADAERKKRHAEIDDPKHEVRVEAR